MSRKILRQNIFRSKIVSFVHFNDVLLYFKTYPWKALSLSSSMVITILEIELVLKFCDEKSEANPRDVRKSAYSQPPLSRRVKLSDNT